MTTSLDCTPVVVDGWGGAGDGCTSTGVAIGAVQTITDMLRSTLPVHWQSTAADRYVERVEVLLRHCAGLVELVETAHRRMVEQSAAVAEAWAEL